MAHVLEAEDCADESPTADSRLLRIQALQAARAILAEWREGRVTTEQAVERLDALARGLAS